MSFEFLRSLRKENLITSEDKYEEDYTFEVADIDEKVCYMNHEDGPN